VIELAATLLSARAAAPSSLAGATHERRGYTPDPLERAIRLIREIHGWMLQPRIVETAGVFGIPDCLLIVREVR